MEGGNMVCPDERISNTVSACWPGRRWSATFDGRENLYDFAPGHFTSRCELCAPGRPKQGSVWNMGVPTTRASGQSKSRSTNPLLSFPRSTPMLYELPFRRLSTVSSLIMFCSFLPGGFLSPLFRRYGVQP